MIRDSENVNKSCFISFLFGLKDLAHFDFSNGFCDISPAGPHGWSPIWNRRSSSDHEDFDVFPHPLVEVLFFILYTVLLLPLLLLLLLALRSPALLLALALH